MFSRELKKGSTELLILALLEARPRHGYELAKLIGIRSGGRLSLRVGSLYPILCRLEDKALIAGRWVEKAGERRRRFYRLTPAGLHRGHQPDPRGRACLSGNTASGRIST
jgi:DNA-binding PadR family transcriptional regulator